MRHKSFKDTLSTGFWLRNEVSMNDQGKDGA